jgi:hypothetical protein
MSDEYDPTRLVEDPDISDGLRAALEADVGVGPSPKQVAEMGAALGFIVPVPPLAVPAAPAGLTAATKIALLFGAGVVGIGAAIGGVLVSREEAPAAPSPSPMPVIEAHAPPEPATEPAPIEETPAAAETPSRARRPRIAAPAIAAPEPVEPAPEPADDDTLAEEMSLVSRAENLVASNPGAALRLANDHRARFATGLLREEREVVAIHALVRLGQVEQAERRAAAFERIHGRSLHAMRIRRVLETARPPPGEP